VLAHFIETDGEAQCRLEFTKREESMAERRSLKEGLQQISPEVDPTQGEAFIFQGKPKPTSAGTESNAPPESDEDHSNTAQPMGRAPLTIRFHARYATALKRASLERQLKGLRPYKLQDIVEEAVEPWLRKNGYLQ
jgi:hypothetical protein